MLACDACVRACPRTCSRAGIRACVHANVCVDVCAYAPACALVCTRDCQRACVRACAHTGCSSFACVRASVNALACLYVRACGCVHMHDGVRTCVLVLACVYAYVGSLPPCLTPVHAIYTLHTHRNAVAPQVNVLVFWCGDLYSGRSYTAGRGTRGSGSPLSRRKASWL